MNRYRGVIARYENEEEVLRLREPRSESLLMIAPPITPLRKAGAEMMPPIYEYLFVQWNNTRHMLVGFLLRTEALA